MRQLRKTTGSESLEPTARPKTLRRRRELLSVVYGCISEYGIDGVSMRQIAEAAQISTGTINYHFENKHNLIIAALEAAYALPADWETYRGSPLAQLQRLAMGHVCLHGRERFWRFWMNYVAHASRDEEMRRHLEDRDQRQQAFWTSLLRDGVAAGEVRPELDPARTAERLLLLARGLVVRQIQSPSTEVREHAQVVLEEFFDDLRVPGVKAPTSTAERWPSPKTSVW